MERIINSYTLLFAIISVILLSGCTDKRFTPGTYDSSFDDIVKGIYFGMEKEDFFKHCWDLNQEGQTNHGTIANMVMYIDSTNYDPKVVINFYPKFEDDKISEMPMLFYYHSWAPWNKNDLKQDSLQAEVVKFFEKKYDTKFEVKSVRENADIYYKFVGPLLVRVYKDIDEMVVKADILNSAYMKEEPK